MKKGLLRIAALVLALTGFQTARAVSWSGNTVQDGTFYLYNVGTGLFLTGGNNWGTHASVSEAGSDFILTYVDGGYTMDSQFSNGGDNHYIAGDFIDGAPTALAFEGSSSGYTIKFPNGKYLAATTGTLAGESDDSSSDNAKWVLVTRQDFLNAMSSATASNPIDVSSLIRAADLSRNDTRVSAWSITRSGGNFTLNGPNEGRASYGGELWNNTYNLHQILTGLPAGTYTLEVAGYSTNGTGQVFINETSAPFVNTTSAANFGAALDQIASGSFKGNKVTTVVPIAGDITIGIKRESQVGADWTVYDNFRLSYYYDESALLPAAEGALATAVAEAKAVVTPLVGVVGIADTWSQDLNEIGTASYLSLTEYATATSSVKEIEANAKAIAEPAAAAAKLLNSVVAWQGAYDPTGAFAAPLTSAKNALKNAVTVDDLTAATAEIKALGKNILMQAELNGTYVDLTDFFMVNPTPTHNIDGWQRGGKDPNWDDFSPATNTAQFWNNAGGSISQTIPDLPEGSYRLTAQALTRTGMHGKLAGNGESVDIATVSNGVVNNHTQAGAWFDAGNGFTSVDFLVLDSEAGATISLTADAQTHDYWTVWRSFKLEYCGETLEMYETVYNQQVALAQQLSTYEPSVEIAANLQNAVNEQLAASEAVVDHNDMASLKAEALALKSVTEPAVVSVNTYAKYVGTVLPNNVGDWTMLSGSNTFHLNTWSTENDESGMKTPFLEYWRNAAENAPLTNAVFRHTVIEGLEPGSYQVTIFMRAFHEGSTISYPDGACVYANQRQVSINTGTQAIFDGNSAEVYGDYSVIGAVGQNGRLEFGVKVQDANFNWLAWKDVRIIPVQGVDIACKTQGSDAIYFDKKKKKAIADGDVKNVSKEINDGIIIDNSDAVVENQALHRAAYRAEAVITDVEMGVSYRFRVTGDETNILALAPGFFEPNKQYDVSLESINFYNFETTVEDLEESDPVRYAAFIAAGYQDCDIYPEWTSAVAPITFTLNTDDKVVASPQLSRHQIIAVIGGEDVTTGINGMDNVQESKDNVFNVAGQRVNGKLTRGLYIVNGKKVIIK